MPLIANVDPPSTKSPCYADLRQTCTVPSVPVGTHKHSAFLHAARRFAKQRCFGKDPRLRPFVLLVRAACRWRVWSVGGMILTGETEGSIVTQRLEANPGPRARPSGRKRSSL